MLKYRRVTPHLKANLKQNTIDWSLLNSKLTAKSFSGPHTIIITRKRLKIGIMIPFLSSSSLLLEIWLADFQYVSEVTYDIFRALSCIGCFPQVVGVTVKQSSTIANDWTLAKLRWCRAGYSERNIRFSHVIPSLATNIILFFESGYWSNRYCNI